MKQKLLPEAVAEFLVSKDYEREQDLVSKPYLTRVKRDLNRLQKHFPGATVAELTGTRLLGYFEARGAAHKTFNNRRGVVSSFLKFAQQRDWIADNPLVKIPARRIRRREEKRTHANRADVVAVADEMLWRHGRSPAGEKFHSRAIGRGGQRGWSGRGVRAESEGRATECKAEDASHFFPGTARENVRLVSGWSFASRKRAQQSTMPALLTTMTRTMFGPFLRVSFFETPSSIIV